MGPVSPSLLLFLHHLWGHDSESPLLPFSPPICAPPPWCTSLLPPRLGYCAFPHPHAHPTQPPGGGGKQASQCCLTHPELYTPNYTELYTVCMPHYTQFRRISPTVTVTGLPSPHAVHTPSSHTQSRSTAVRAHSTLAWCHSRGLAGFT